MSAFITEIKALTIFPNIRIRNKHRKLLRVNVLSLQKLRKKYKDNINDL